MKNRLPIIITLAVLIINSMSIAAQNNKIVGSIVDAGDATPLPYTRIISNCLKEPLMSDENGNFELYLQGDTCELEFFRSLYQSYKRTIFFSGKQRVVKLKRELN